MSRLGIISTKILAETPESNFRLVDKLQPYTQTPDTVFMFSDQFTYVPRYLNKIGYRKCIMVHRGDVPKHTIGGYQTHGGFSSYLEIREYIINENDVIIDISE